MVLSSVATIEQVTEFVPHSPLDDYAALLLSETWIMLPVWFLPPVCGDEHSSIPVPVEFLGVPGNVCATRVPPPGLGSRALPPIALQPMLLLLETVM